MLVARDAFIGSASFRSASQNRLVGAPRPRSPLLRTRSSDRLYPPSIVTPSPGGEGRLTVDVAGDSALLRKVPTPGVTGAGGSPPGESPSSGAETTQSRSTVMASRRRFCGNMVKRPTSREQAPMDGVKATPRPSRGARSRMLPETEWGLLPPPGRLVSKMAGRRPGNGVFGPDPHPTR